MLFLLNDIESLKTQLFLIPYFACFGHIFSLFKLTLALWILNLN